MRTRNQILCIIVLTIARQLMASSLMPPNNPDAIVDLKSTDSVQLLKAQWRYHDGKIIEVEHQDVGADLKPSGPPNHTNDVSPHAGSATFDDSDWEIIDPTSLETRRSHGRLSFGWYRTQITIPERVGAYDPRGSVAVLEVVVDDYAEIWVNGRLPQVLGQVGGPLAAGWNSPNRLVLTRDAQPGQQIQIAIFAANGPLSEPPGNYVWIRSATVDFYRPERWSASRTVPCTIDRRDPAIDKLIPTNAILERVADGFDFAEGPVWVPAKFGGAGSQPIDEGYLLFSDPNRNTIYRLASDGIVSVYRTKSGYSGMDIAEYRQPGSNGLGLDAHGRLTICEHGNRRVTRLEPNGSLTVLADKFEDKRLNSPNDLIYRSDGALFFTDPPFGLPQFHRDPRRESPHTGVYGLVDGQLKLVSSELTGPNGIDFSPDEQYMYVTNWDVQKKIIMRYTMRPDGTAENGTVFFDMTSAPGEEALDGLEIDRLGNLYVSGPSGVWVISPEGVHLGLIKTPELPANFAWGEDDRRTLYMTARTGIYRMKLIVGGRTS